MTGTEAVGATAFDLTTTEPTTHTHLATPTVPPVRVPWPDGRQGAVSFTFDLDAESAILWADPRASGRMSVMSHQAYGPLVGAPRLLRMLDHHGIRATFFVPGYSAHRYPALVRDIVDAGHEIAHHGYLHETLAGLTEQQELACLRRGLEALEEVAGVRPSGFRGPMGEINVWTPRLLVEHGFTYDASMMDSDWPYELAVDDSFGRSVVEIPWHWGQDDWEQYCYLPDLSGSGYIASPTKTLEMWRLELSALCAEGGCCTFIAHPFLSGRPARAAVLDRLMAEAVADPGLWVAPMVDIAVHIRSLELTPRWHQPPIVEGPVDPPPHV